MTEERLMELLQVAAWLSEKYTGGASTSVTYEKAQELMEAVLYCVREYEQEQALLYALAAKGGVSGEEAYKSGYALVVRKVKKMRAYYNRLSETFCSYGCRSYEDVFRKELPEFFRRYDPRFAPQKTPLSLDYPTLLPLGALTGIDAVEQYLSCLSMEQKFMGAFDERYVYRSLNAYDENYREQFFNLCGVFLQDVLIGILMRKPLWESLREEHWKRLEQRTAGQTREAVKEELQKILRRLVQERFAGNELLYEYLCGALPDLVVRLEACTK